MEHDLLETRMVFGKFTMFGLGKSIRKGARRIYRKPMGLAVGMQKRAIQPFGTASCSWCTVACLLTINSIMAGLYPHKTIT